MKDHFPARLARPLLSCWLLLAFTQTLRADSPMVQFDTAPLITCRDVTTAQFAAENPDERLLEAKLEISTLLGEVRDDDLLEYFFRVSSPGQKLLVADYQPKTTLASDYAGNISVEERNEKTKSAGVTVSGVLNHLVKITGSGDLGSKDSLATRYELLAPMEPVTASGTILRGTGVYFKLRPSRQTALEGSRSFLLTLRAPRSWRGDYLQVHCEAHGVRRGVVRGLDEPVRTGMRDFFVALYLAGDQEAKSQAERMVQTEQVLRQQLLYHRETILESPRMTLSDQLASFWGTPRRTTSPVDRIERLLFSPGFSPQVPAGLPKSLATALRAYLQARASLRSLS